MISILAVFTVSKFFCGGKPLFVLKKLSCQHLSFGREFLEGNSVLFYIQ